MFTKKVTPQLCKKMRQRAGLSQEELGKQMGWSLRTVVSRETKEFRLTLAEFEKFILVTTSSAEEKALRKEVFKKIEDAVDLLIGGTSTTNSKTR